MIRRWNVANVAILADVGCEPGEITRFSCIIEFVPTPIVMILNIVQVGLTQGNPKNVLITALTEKVYSLNSAGQWSQELKCLWSVYIG